MRLMITDLKPLIRCLGAMTLVVFTGCSTSQSSQQSASKPASWVYKVPDADLQRYTRFMVDPVVVYRGDDARYEGINDAQVTEIAQLLTSETRRTLSNGYTLTPNPGPNTARIVMKLAGVEEAVVGDTKVSRVVPIGALKDTTGGSGVYTGAIVLAVEVYDSQTSKLLSAALRRYNPPAFDSEASVSTMDTARAAARAAAADLRAAIDRVHGRTVRAQTDR